MFSADFRAGLTRVAVFGRKVLAFSENSSALEHSEASRWRLFVPAAITVALLIVGAWYAGRESAGLEAERVSAQVNELASEVASNELALKQERAKTDRLERALQSSGKSTSLALQAQLRQQLLKAQAEANDYKAIIDRERQVSKDNSRLLDALSTPGTHLLSLKGAESAADSTAYALLVVNSRLLFVASNLPEPAEGRQFQLWLKRKQDPKIVSAGVFTPDDDNRTLMSFDDPSVLSDISVLEVTDEPEGGSAAPTGTKLLETESNTAEPSRSATEKTDGFIGADLLTEPWLLSPNRDTLR